MTQTELNTLTQSALTKLTSDTLMIHPTVVGAYRMYVIDFRHEDRHYQYLHYPDSEPPTDSDEAQLEVELALCDMQLILDDNPSSLSVTYS